MGRAVVVSALKWFSAGVCLAGVFGTSYVVHDWVLRERAAAEAGPVPVAPSPFGIVKLTATQAERSGIKDVPAVSISWAERVAVFGQVVPNPAATVEVRALFAGTLQQASAAAWPTPGTWLKAGTVLARLEIRAAPQDRLDWQAKLIEAKQKQQSAEQVVKIHQAHIDRLKQASAGEVVSRREFDEALVQLAEARAQLAGATAAVKLWQDAVAGSDRAGEGSLWNQPVTAPADGEAVDLTARPGASIEAGTVLLRLVDFRRPLVRLDIPHEALAAGPPRTVHLEAIGSGTAATPVTGQLVGIAPQVDAASQQCACWYEVTAPSPPDRTQGRVWRPGLLVKSFVPRGDAPLQPVVGVPTGALLYHQGRALVYVRIDASRYERREVRLLGRDGDRWIIGAGIQAGERVVAAQAQVLLSQEFNTDND